MIFNTLYDSAQRGELMLVGGGFCHWHLRRDGQLTIREIISTRRGAGLQMLNRLKLTPGATSLFAKCPAGLAANSWYARRGFHCDHIEFTSANKPLMCWKMDISQIKRTPNAQHIEVIYCADGNRKLMEIAIDNGLLTGARLPGTIYYRPYFADQDYKKPNREKYMTALAEHRPHIATVLDWDANAEFDEVLSWADEASQYAEVIVIIPKRWHTIHLLPRQINGKQVRLGYSVPTRFGGTNVPLVEFQGWPVHLLGGSPEKQIALATSLDVQSVDTNYTAKMALRYNQYWMPTAGAWQTPYWPRLDETGGVSQDAPYEAFARSCRNIMQAWRTLDIVKTDEFQLALVL